MPSPVEPRTMMAVAGLVRERGGALWPAATAIAMASLWYSATPGPTVGDKIDDASITAQVKSTLLSHSSTSALHTSVSTTDGVVTLGGIAKNDAEKSLVTKLVTDINGVTSVINNMTVGLPMAAN